MRAISRVLNKEGMTPTALHFRKHRYVVLKNFIPQGMIEFAKQCWWRTEDSKEWGSSKQQERSVVNTPNGASKQLEYVSEHMANVPFGEAMLVMLKEPLENALELSLIPTYSFARTYYRDAKLFGHTDRPSCEVSMTFPIEYQTDDKKPWSIWVLGDKNYVGVDYQEAWDIVQGKNFEERFKLGAKRVYLEPGDVLAYQGCNAIHWRDKLVGKFSRHIFAHYVDANGPLYAGCPDLNADGRPSVYHDHDHSTIAEKAKDAYGTELSKRGEVAMRACANITDPYTNEPILHDDF